VKRKRLMTRVIVAVTCILMIIHARSLLHAHEIRSIHLAGRTVDIDLSRELKRAPGELSDNDIRDLAVRITNAYHSRGYTAAFIEKITVRKDGVLEMRVHESVVESVSLDVSGNILKDELYRVFSVLEGEVYNENRLNLVIRSARKRFSLNSLKVDPGRSGTGDIILSVSAGRQKGHFYGGIGVDMAYGIRPLIGYYRPSGSKAADIKITAGIRDGEISMAGGDITLYCFRKDSRAALYMGLGGSSVADIWQLRDKEYTLISVRPVLGVRYFTGMAVYDLSLSEKISSLRNYRDSDSCFSDTRLTADVHINNGRRKIDERKTGDLRLSVSGGWEDFTGSAYASASLNARQGIIPFYSLDWLCIIPRLAVTCTTSGERLFREYVYDSSFIVASGDYTASSWKNVAGLVCEAAVADSGFYIGPFINTGYYLDEQEEWATRTGTGIRCRMGFRDIRIEAYYAWEVPGDPSAGAIIILAQGTF